MIFDLAWLGFWLFMAVFIFCDAWIFTSGRDSYLHIHKTDAEKALQKEPRHDA